MLDDDNMEENDEALEASPESDLDEPAVNKEEKPKSTISADLIRGHINTIILRTLSERDKYGYEIIDEIEKKSHGQYELKQPTLYSALKRLETQGYIKAYWKTDEISAGGRRKYFTLTESGKSMTERNRAEWEYSRTVIDSLISDQVYDFSKPAPTPVDFKILKQSTTRVPTVRLKERVRSENGETESDEKDEYNDDLSIIEYAYSDFKNSAVNVSLIDLQFTEAAADDSGQKKEIKADEAPAPLPTPTAEPINEEVNETTAEAVEKTAAETSAEPAAGPAADSHSEPVSEPDSEANDNSETPQASEPVPEQPQIDQEFLQQYAEQVAQQVAQQYAEQIAQQYAQQQNQPNNQQFGQQPAPQYNQQFVQQTAPQYNQQFAQQPAPQYTQQVSPQQFYAEAAPVAAYNEQIYAQRQGYEQPPIQQQTVPYPYNQPTQEQPVMPPQQQQLQAEKAQAEAEQTKKLHENYMKLLDENYGKKDTQKTNVYGDNIDTEKLIYNNKPVTERDYKNLINDMYAQTIRKQPPKRFVQPEPEPVQQNVQPEPQPEPVREQPVPEPVLRVPNDEASRAESDGLKIFRSESQVKPTGKYSKNYNLGETLFKCSAIAFIYLALIFALTFVYRNELGLAYAYPFVIFALAACIVMVCAVMALSGFGKNAIKPVTHGYIAVSIVLSVIAIFIVCVVAILLEVDFYSIADIFKKMVIPSLCILTAPLFTSMFYLFSK